jgi:xanthine dehydrogenase YagR molybdenum-binding subunit
MSTTLLGQPHDRVDGRLKVTGQAIYTSDQPAKNLAYGYLVTSRIAKGEIRSVDVGVATKSPGVLAIYTPFNPLKLFRPADQAEGANSGEPVPPLQSRKVLYYGQIIGLVVAESFEQARDASALIKVDYSSEALAAGWGTGKSRAFAPDEIGDEKATVAILADGVSSIDDVLKNSPVVVQGIYRELIQHHNPMEPHSTLAIWEGDRVTVYEGSQFVVGLKRMLASVLNVDDSKVRVLSHFVGGGFGCKGSSWMHSPLNAAAARALNRPVKTVLTREQMFTLVGHRPALIQTISLGADQSGALQAVKHDVRATTAAVKPFVEAAAHRTSRHLYQSANIQVSETVLPLDVGAPIYTRAPGHAPGMFALESAMDELAVKLGLDPVELRMKNYAQLYPGKKIPWTSKNLADCYRIGADKFGWSNRNPIPASVKDGDWFVGVGMATALHGANRTEADAKVRFLADGMVQVSSATHDMGTGMWTAMSMIGAEALGLPIDRIRPDLGDSDLPYAPGAGGSKSTASVGPAIQKAAESAKKKLIQLAIRDRRSPFRGMTDVSYDSGRLTSGGKTEEFDSVLHAVGRGSVDATETSAPGDEQEKYALNSFGAHFCEVKVNRWTGEVRVQRVTTVMDIGRVVNLKTARSQVIGGVVFGIGMALLEGSVLEEKTGRYANANFADYLIPTNADVPVIDVYFVDKPDLIFNPLGVRGVGEIGITGIPAAIANAVYNATGKRVRDFPITPDKVLMAEASQSVSA